MEVTKHQLQQQVDFAKGILDILQRQETNIPEERVADAKSAEAYCELVIKSCELAAELLDREEAAKKEQPPAVDTTAAEEPAEKPKRSRKKKKEDASEPVVAEPIPAEKAEVEDTAGDELDDLF